MGMDVGAAAVLPDPGVGCERLSQSARAQWLEHREQCGVALVRQPLVEEHLRRRQDDAAVDVVLDLMHGGVADADGTVVPVAPKVRRQSLVERHLWENGVSWFEHGATFERD